MKAPRRNDRPAQRQARPTGLRHRLENEPIHDPGLVAEIAHRTTEWTVAVQPRDPIDRQLIAHAAAASVRLDRALAREHAAAIVEMRQTASRWLELRRTQVRKRTQKLYHDPVHT